MWGFFFFSTPNVVACAVHLPQICITATHLLGDVLRASGAAIRKYTDEYMRCIVNNLMVRV